MRLSRLFLVLLLLPGFALGPGWRLTFCLQKVGSTASCCSVTSRSCCANGAEPGAEPAAVQERCAACCIDIEASVERRAPTQDGFTEQLERSQVVALMVSTPLADAIVLLRPAGHAVLGPSWQLPGASTRSSLPLRI